SISSTGVISSRRVMIEPSPSDYVEETPQRTSSSHLVTISGSGDDLAPFQTIPKEIVWDLIEFVPEIVFNLRLVSRRFHSIVNEYALRQETIALVDELDFYGTLDRRTVSSEDDMDVLLDIPMNKSNLFELRVKLRNFSPNVMSQIMRHPKDLDSEEIYTYRMKCNIKSLNQDVMEKLKECIGKRVGRVTFSQCTGETLLATISRIIEGMRFSRMKLESNSLSTSDAKHFLDTIEQYHIEQVTVQIRETANPAKFFRDLSKYVRSMYINMKYNHYANDNEQIVHDNDWPVLIQEMFSRKLDKLYIKRDNRPPYLSDANALILKQNLVNSDKNIWFAISFRYGKKEANEVNDYTVKVDIFGHEKQLRIIHYSRTNEQF
ncbi:hypothetical protein PMAYCL1PPCAC_32148, partial [Pristionchus mayeri]